MKQFSLKKLFPLIVALLVTPLLSYGDFGNLNLVREHRDRTFDVEITTEDGAQQSIVLVAREAGELRLRPRGARTTGDEVVEIFTSVSRVTDINFVLGTDWSIAREAFREGNYEIVRDRLKPIVYGLVPYHAIPSTNLFIVLETYLTALLRLEEFEEAFYLARSVRLSQTTPGFLDLTMQLSRSLFDQDKQDPALRLINALPFDQAEGDLLQVILEFGHDLRRSDRFEEALMIYGRILAIEDSPLAEVATLWQAYSNVRTERIETARLFLDRLGDPPGTNDRFFSLYQLIRARIYMQEEDVPNAIRVASRGVVFALLDQEWVPDLLFVTAQAYEAKDRLKQAREIYREINLFFPDSPWASLGQERIDEISISLGT